MVCFAAGALGALGACATRAPGDQVLQVHNRSKLSITSIQLSDCGGRLNAGRELLEQAITPTSTRNIALPSTCVNLLATNSRGQIAGEQRDLRMQPGASWTIR